MSRASGAPRPLTGMTVVSVEQAVAAPFATRQLADLGARVVKIERPGSGDFARAYDTTVHGLSSVFVWLNRGKDSVTLDVRSPDGRALLGELLGSADAFVHNLAPAAALRAGIDGATLREQHPDLITCAVSGYGSGGPLRDAKAYDLLVQGETGMLSITGNEAGMAKVGISIADIAAGMYAYSAILAALLHRQRTGEVLPVEVSLFDALTEWMAYPLYYTRYGGRAPTRMGISHPTIAPYGTFLTADGDPLLVAVQNDQEWRRLCELVLDDPARALDARFLTNSARVEHRAELDILIGQRLAALGTARARALLDEAEIASARVNDITELADHPQLVARDRWVPTSTSAGSIDTLYPPALPGEQRHELGGVPALGEQTVATLRRLGRTDADIDLLRTRKVI